ncbi:MAG: helix-turn-helix transcriptional regulator [Planctomycetota bacterium]
MAMRFFQSQYRDPALSLEGVAEEVCWSSDHLGRAFRRAVGMTPMRYLRRLRITQAESLLIHTDLRVGEVAREVGFSDLYHFSRVFRRDTGMSPREYRNGGEQRGGEGVKQKNDMDSLCEQRQGPCR